MTVVRFRCDEEILSQLRELIKLELDLFHGEVDAAEPQKQFENLSTGFERDIETNMFPSYEINKPYRPLASGDYSFGTGLILMFDSGIISNIMTPISLHYV
ncbi:hypothetical protein VIGAN_04370500 [Vigna angularis var. angularis]|uniref:Uncharacterized protein n=1 Tax=Vigna angularis var. angularis TaxID=157739 RepID=A0A0S3RZS8_PHAAN|nr:hypothetical protein VIGAN_04370500 [Vigna angularis var. angularis]